MALRLVGPRLAMMRVEGFVPFYRKIQEDAKKKLYRQLPFLKESKVASTRPPVPDPLKRALAKVDIAKEINLKVGDKVQILYGGEKGQQGIVRRILHEKNQVIVSGMNLKRSFWHPEPGPGKPSIVSVECPIHVTNVILLDPVTKQPTRVKRRYMMNGECVRVSKVSGSAMPDPVPVGVSEREVLFAKHMSQSLIQEKSRRGPPKDNVFGDRERFKTLVRISREHQATSASFGAAQMRQQAQASW